MENMKRPSTRAEFERNFHLLGQTIREGKFHMPRDMAIHSIANIRFLPNRRIDFLSVDELARLQANTMAQFHDGPFKNFAKESPADEESPPPGSETQANASDVTGKKSRKG